MIRSFVLVDSRELQKAKQGGKYLRRVPYTDSKGKRRYRYYYSEEALARDVERGEEVWIGGNHVKVHDVIGDKIRIEVDGKRLELTGEQWGKTLAHYHGDKYLKAVAKRSRQTVDAVLRHVPKKLLEDLEGDSDSARLADLQYRAPEVFKRLQTAFRRAGINPFRAKAELASLLERRNWAPEARAAAIGNVIKDRRMPMRSLIRASESLAGAGSKTGAEHVAAAVELGAEIGDVARIASRAEAETEALRKALDDLGTNPTARERAQVLAQALANTASARLEMLSRAFPGLKDRALGPMRETRSEAVSVAPGPLKKVGAVATVFVAGEGGQPQAMQARYELREAGDVVASHDPVTFQPHKNYPEGLQERAYHRDVSEQGKVRINAQVMRPEFVVNTNPDAVNGPPIVTGDNVVLGGNSRTMSVQRAYREHPEQAEKFKRYLADHAHEVGLRPEDVHGFKNPVLVRVVEGEHSPETQRVLVRQMNESFTQGMDPRTMQVAQGRRLTESAIKVLGQDMEEGETLNAFLGTPRAKRFLVELNRAGVIDRRNSNQYMKKDGSALNQDGRTMVARVLVGRVIGDAELLGSMQPSQVENIAKSLPYMLRAKEYGAGFDVTDSLRTAADALVRLQDRVEAGAMPGLKSDMSPSDYETIVESYFKQLPGVGEDHPVLHDRRARTILEAMIRRGGSSQWPSIWKDFAREAERNPEGQGGLFGSKDPEAIFGEVLESHIAKSRGEKKAAKSDEKTHIKVQPEPEKSETGESGPPPTNPPKGTPRAEAKEQTKEMFESEYVNDRKSAIEQRGEDVAGSARHKAADWKSLREALDSDKADKMFTRDFLMKQEPIDLITPTQVQPINAASILGMHLAMKKFPNKPEVGNYLDTRASREIPMGPGRVQSERLMRERFYAKPEAEQKKLVDEYVKSQRESYYEAFKTLNSLVEKHSRNPSPDPIKALRDLKDDIKDAAVKRRNDHDMYDAGYDALVTVHNKMMKGKSGAYWQINEFLSMYQDKYDEKPTENMKRVAEHAMKMMEGASMNAAFGTKSDRKRIDPSTFYSAAMQKPERKGPESEFKGVKQGLDALYKGSGGKYEMRAVQWGKSVTDAEREHHLKQCVDSFQDLMDVCGLPPAMASYNGKLALAIGARGKAGALAHYEDDLQVINLTRTGGSGALAHEWGHFFDFTLSRLTGDRRKGDTLSRSASMRDEHPVRRAMAALRDSEGFREFAEQTRRGVRSAKRRGVSANIQYWGSTHELFARAFERYTQRKLELAGRKNTYLSGTVERAYTGDEALWPSDTMVDKMAPYFDALFTSFKESDLLHKALGQGPIRRFKIVRPRDLLKGGPYIGPKGGKWADPAHTIPWKEQDQKRGGVRTGVIPVDHKAVAEIADKMLSNSNMKRVLDQEWRKEEGLPPLIQISGRSEHFHGPAGMLTVRLEPDDSQINSEWSDTDLDHDLPIRGSLRTMIQDGSKYHVLMLRVPSRVAVPRVKALKRAMRSTIAHEITHQADPGLQRMIERKFERVKEGEDSGDDAKSDDYESYLNQPHEVTATLQQIHRDLISPESAEHAKTLWERKQKLESGNVDPELGSIEKQKKSWKRHFNLWLRTNSRYYSERMPWYSEKNAKRINQMIFRTFEGLGRGTIEPKEKSLWKASELPKNHAEDRTRKTGGRKLAKRITWNGLEISIETARGQTRTWYDPETDEHGETTMLYDYGYVRGSVGADGDHVDVFVGPDPNAPEVYIVDQMKRPAFRSFDEQKVMLGFPSLDAARAAYLKHYNDPRFLGSIRAMARSEFIEKVTGTSAQKPLI